MMDPVMGVVLTSKIMGVSVDLEDDRCSVDLEDDGCSVDLEDDGCSNTNTNTRDAKNNRSLSQRYVSDKHHVYRSHIYTVW